MPGDEEIPEDELEKRLRKLLGDEDAETREPRFPEPPDIEDIQLELSSEKKGARLPDVPDWNYQRPDHLKPDLDDKHNYRGLGYGITVAYALVGFMILGWGIGWLIHRSNQSEFAQPLGALAGSIAGIVASIILMNRAGGGKR